MSLKLAVSGSVGGPATVPDGLLLSGRGSSPRVHTAPAVPQARLPGSVTVTALREPGSTVISHRSWRPSTRRAPVTLPSVTVKDSPREDSPREVLRLISMSSLKTTRKVKAPSPSCSSGRSSNEAVSSGGAPLFRMAPVASPSSIVAPTGLLRVSVTVSLPSSTVSSAMGTAMVFSVSPGSKVREPLVAV